MKKYNIINDVLGWACFVVAALTYMLTLEPTASFWDCPEFIAQGAKLEVGHPPGNPIFMLAARFFVTLFGGEMANAAIAVNTMSALLSAATILLLFWTITHLVRRLVVRDEADTISPWQMALIFGGGICGALAYTWSDTFWFSAVEGEVYAFSSFCTALVFWLILKWENRADQTHSDRYLILIAYIIGVSIAVHLLNLLCIPAIVLVFYYKRFKNVNAKGSLLALCVSFVIVALILFGLVPGFVKVAQWFELLFVNSFGMPYNSGVLAYACLLVAVFVWAIYSLYRQSSPTAIKWGFFISIVLSGMPFIGEWWVALLLITGLAVYLFGFCPRVPVRIFNVITLSVFLIFVGYSSYALLLIRSHANTPMNQNAPDNVFSLGSYLNREQYGQTPLLRGPVFAEEMIIQEYPEGSGVYYVQMDEYGRPATKIHDGVLRDENGMPYSDPKMTHIKVVKTSPSQPDKYVETLSNPNYSDIPDLKMWLSRIFSTNAAHVDGYKGWSQYSTPDINAIPLDVRRRWAEQGFVPLYEVAPYLTSQERIATIIDHSGKELDYAHVWKPGVIDNLRYFFNYQFSHMYWRYFMWNFAGRQNDIAGNGEPHLGNWISGISFIDNMRLGDQSLLPDEFGKGNKGHNVFYMLPLLLGIIGLLWQALYIKRDAPQRGIEQFWVVCFLFFMTGIAIVLYLNQTPGQPRERDYAFAGSFYAFAIWIGIGVPAIGMMLRSFFAKIRKTSEGTLERRPEGIVAAAVAVLIGLAVPLQMVSQTWDDHDRSGRYVARDFGMNYLSSVDKDAVIFCNGDNDTFPLWYAQEVEGYRTDVRVINLMYLTTDWYANQQLIQSYDGKPIEIYATPADYAGDRMSYAFVVPKNPAPVNAEVSLRELYASPAIYQQPVMTSPNIVMPVDTAAVFAHYGIDAANAIDSKYIIPYISDVKTNINSYAERNAKGGLNLGNIISLDIIANSVKNGFNRPVYFASTVPTSYYLDLSPYMYMTGMASEVTPFFDSSVSPLVEKAYENIVGKFRWGGLDCENPESLYLDETVRRMVASTRSSMLDVIRSLMNSGAEPASQCAKDHALASGTPVPETRYDMARILLHTMEDKLPAAASLLDSDLVTYMAETYYDLYIVSHNPADLEAAERLLNDNLPRFARFVRYATGLSHNAYSQPGYDFRNVDNLSVVIGLLNRIAVLRVLEQDPDLNSDFIEVWAPRSSADLHTLLVQMLYIEGYSADDIRDVIDEYSGNSRVILEAAVATLDAHDAAGIEPMAMTEQIIADYGINHDAWSQMVR